MNELQTRLKEEIYKCKYCKRKYKRYTGIWIIKHFRKEHPNKQMIIEVKTRWRSGGRNEEQQQTKKSTKRKEKDDIRE